MQTRTGTEFGRGGAFIYANDARHLTLSHNNLSDPSRSLILPVAIMIEFSFHVSGYLSRTFGKTTTSIFAPISSIHENSIGFPVLVTIFCVFVIMPPTRTVPARAFKSFI